jgi:hypothetical protein
VVQSPLLVSHPRNHRVANSWSVTQTCNYCGQDCGSQQESVNRTCSVWYDKYCLRSCTCVFFNLRLNMKNEIFIYKVLCNIF